MIAAIIRLKRSPGDVVLEAAVAQLTLPVEEIGVGERVSGQSATVSAFVSEVIETRVRT
jgi:hypothetical protein